MVHYLPAPPVPAEPAVDVARVEALPGPAEHDQHSLPAVPVG